MWADHVILFFNLNILEINDEHWIFAYLSIVVSENKNGFRIKEYVKIEIVTFYSILTAALSLGSILNYRISIRDLQVWCFMEPINHFPKITWETFQIARSTDNRKGSQIK